MILGLSACQSNKAQKDFDWVIDHFDDIRILRYQVPGFDELDLNDKITIYYLNLAALQGREILFDQNFKYNLAILRTFEAIYTDFSGDKTSADWLAFEKYLKKMWFANGIHHHYSMDKFTPEFSEEFFVEAFDGVDQAKLPADYGDKTELLALIKPILFDADLYRFRLNQKPGVDMLQSSAMNYYDGLTQKEAEDFYASLIDTADRQPVSYGLNSTLVKEDGKITEQVWRIGEKYSGAIEKIVYYLEKAKQTASAQQKQIIESLIAFYTSGDLKDFDDYNILWVQDTVSIVDFVCCFTEVYGDPLGYKGAWEGLVNFKNLEATKRTEALSGAAQWFEDNSPINPAYRKPQVKGVSAKVITVTSLGGDCFPSTPIGINLPNSGWIRRDYGSKSVTIQNITDAYAEASRSNGFNEEFILRDSDRELVVKHGGLGGNLHTDLHECLGHGSGQLADGVSGNELKNYGSTLEEARADLFALYYIADPKLIELGITESDDVAKAEYINYIMNGMMTQLTRIKLGDDVEQAHMRNRKLISEWCYEKGRADNVIEKVVENGKTYIVINDFSKLRELFGDMLKEVQRIKSEGDYQSGKDLVEGYAVKIDRGLHQEVLARYEKLGIEPFSGFVNPEYELVMDNGKVVDVKVSYPNNYAAQLLDYSKKYTHLPVKN